MLFLVDTGAPGVCLDKSLEPKLGKCLWTQPVHEFYGIKRMKMFRAQNLYFASSTSDFHLRQPRGCIIPYAQSRH